MRVSLAPGQSMHREVRALQPYGRAEHSAAVCKQVQQAHLLQHAAQLCGGQVISLQCVLRLGGELTPHLVQHWAEVIAPCRCAGSFTSLVRSQS